MALSENWFFWAMASMVFQGTHALLYKKLIEDGGDAHLVQVVIPVVVCLLAAVAIIVEGRPGGIFGITMATIAVIQGALFYLTTALRLEALRSGAPAHIVFPLVKSSVVLIIVLSAILFDEWESLKDPRRLAGVILAVMATFSLMEWRASQSRDPMKSGRGIAYAVLAMLASGGASLMAKYLFVGGGDISIFAFALLSNLMTMMFAMGVALKTNHKPSRKAYNYTLTWGVFMGVLSFAGFIAFLQAIKIGDLSAVAAVNAMAILIPVLAAAVLYGERLTFRKEVAVFLFIIALVLIG